MSINERIKHLRTELLKDSAGKKMTLEDFGARIAIGKTAISKIEKGENNPSEQTVKMICREFNVREEWLRDGEGEPFLAMDQDDKIMDAVGRILADEPDSFRRRVISVLAQLPPEHWEVIRQICDKIKKD